MAQLTTTDDALLSDWWMNGRTDSQPIVSRVELLDTTGAPFRSSDPSATSSIVVTDCQVTQDRSRSVWGSCDTRLLIPWDADQSMLDLLPTDPMAPLAPTSGVTFRVSAGFRNPFTGRDEMVWCGRYDIESNEVTETAEGVVVQLQGLDMTSRLEGARVAWPVDLPWGWRVIDIATWLINNAIPGAAFQTDPSDAVAARIVLDEQVTFMSEVTKALTSIGFELLADASGQFFILRRLPSSSDTPTWVFDPADVNWVHKLGQDQSRDRVYNGVAAKGENPNSTDPPVRAFAWITDPSDPTYFIIGPPSLTNIGPRVKFLTSQYIRTQEQAQDAADSELRRVRGLLQRVNIEMAFNPAIEAGDVIYLERPGIGVQGSYVVQSRSFDVSGGPLRLTCEERRV
jgi:hypothetical protein